MDGTRPTDSTWLHHATRDLTEHGRSARWHWRPGWHRTVIRLVILAVITGAAYGWFTARGALMAGAIVAGVLAVMLGSFRGYQHGRQWSHRRHVIYPLWHILATMTGYSVDYPGQYQSSPDAPAGHPAYHRREAPEKFLTIPPDFADNPKAVIRWEPPYTWEGNIPQQKAVTGVIQRRLGGDWAADWTMNASPRFLVMRHAPQPPARVMFDDFRPYLDAAPENVLRLGQGTGGTMADIDLDSEAPHVAISAGTGGGKTETLALIITRLVRTGCERVDIIDPKRVSHNWARGLPGVHIHKYVAGQMQAIRDARLVMDSRYDALDTSEDVSFSRRVLIIEEQNSLMADLKEYWEDYRRELTPSERAAAPKVNPAIRDLRYILNKGRQCRINVISVFQRMSAAAVGDGDMRENFGAKILARYSPGTWKILVATPYIRPSRVPGRAMLVLGDESSAIQRVYVGLADSTGKPDPAAIARLRAYALNGRPDPRRMGQAATASADAMTAASMASGTAPGPVGQAAADPAGDEPVTLREACEAGVLPMRYQTARKRRQRDAQSFPAGLPGQAGQVYQPSALRAWLADWEARQAGQRARAAA